MTASKVFLLIRSLDHYFAWFFRTYMERIKVIMNWIRKFCFSTALLFVAVCFIKQIQAATMVFTVDQSQSEIAMSGLMAGFAMMPQGPVHGSGALITSYSGSINANLSGSAIQFTGGSAIIAQTNGVWQPAAGGVAGSAAADYGPKAMVFISSSFVTVNGALRNISFDMTSPVLTINSGGFAGTNLVFSFASNNAVFDYNDGVAGSVPLAGYATNTVATAATLTVNGGKQTLFIPIDAQFVFSLLSANDSTIHLMGQIGATNFIVASVPIIKSISITNQDIAVTAENAATQSQLLVSTNLTSWSTASFTTTTNNLGWIIFTTPMNGSRAFFRVEQ